MIETVFPLKVLIKDCDKSPEFSAEVSTVIQAIFRSVMVENSLDRSTAGDNEFRIFTQENLELFPVLRELQQLFIDGFYELASVYDYNPYTRDMIEKMVSVNHSKLPLMFKGDYKRLHTHTNTAAFAIFYCSTVDNDQHGGKLVLKDPSFHSNLGFHPSKDYEVETKRNRLVVAPGYVWHEVTPYTGEDVRVAVVINLHLEDLPR